MQVRGAPVHADVALVLMSGSCAAGPRTLWCDQRFTGGDRRSRDARGRICGAGSMPGGGGRRSDDADARAAVDDSRLGGAGQRHTLTRPRTVGASAMHPRAWSVLQSVTVRGPAVAMRGPLVQTRRIAGSARRHVVLMSKLTTRAPLLT